MLRAWCVVIGTVLVAGALIPYAVEDPDSEHPISWSVLSTLPLASQEQSETEGGGSGEGVLFIIGFLGLALVVVAMLVTLAPVMRRTAGRATLVTMRVLITLGAIGAVVVLLLTVMVLGDSSVQARPGAVVLLLGNVLYGTLLAEPARRYWQAPVRADHPPAVRTPPRTA